MKKLYHMNILTLSQKCRSDVAVLERLVEQRTILSVMHSSSWSMATGAVFLQMSASTHLECYRGASRCVLIGGSQPIERNESLYGRKWDISVPRLYELRKILYGTF